MFFPPVFSDTQSAGTNNKLLGTTQKFNLDRLFPIEEILLIVNFVVDSGGLTLVTSPGTNDQYENILQLVSNINLSVNDGTKPRSVVNSSGIALLEYCQRVGFNCDEGTLMLAALQQVTTLPAGKYQMCYRLPMVDPKIGETLRSRMYLPVHKYPQDPTLSVTFQTLANIASAGTMSQLTCEVVLVRREPTAASEALLAQIKTTNPWGYIDFDLIETPFTIPLGVGTEQRFALPIPGLYGNLLFRHYLGGASITRKEIDNGATGTSFGNESRWRVESGGVVDREWRWKHLRMMSEMNGCIPAMFNASAFVAATSAGSPTTQLQALMMVQGLFGGSLPFPTTSASFQNFRYSNTGFIDFLGDGLSGEMINELGSLLDCNNPSTKGLKMEIIGSPTSVATNASSLMVLGRRYFGDLSAFKQLR
jgi:hypothetical protein